MASPADDTAAAPARGPLRRYWFDVVLWKRIFGALVLGAIAGALLGEQAESIKWIGDLFIRLIRMVVVPLVFVSIVAGVTGMGDPRRLGSIGGKTLLLYLCTTVIAVIVGQTLGALIGVGHLVGLAVGVAMIVGVLISWVGIVPYFSGDPASIAGAAGDLLAAEPVAPDLAEQLDARREHRAVDGPVARAAFARRRRSG